MKKTIFAAILRFIVIVIMACVLTQCVAPALLLAPQGQLMWALLKPLVGLDPKEANLFKQPLIQSRLEPLLGSHYAGAVQLLETADKIQQEGPLFYVVSKYTPVPELAEKAGFRLELRNKPNGCFIGQWRRSSGVCRKTKCGSLSASSGVAERTQ
ncbi:MAG: hypothetical protein U5L02_10745 [Rheinheimera sp.]|nr:hypothetical protein [Rheinheimera sp.]